MTDVQDIRFPTPDEVEGFWAFDKMHAPRPLHPLSQDLVMTTLGEGFTLGQGYYDCPLAATSRAFHNYFFMAFHPYPDEAVIADRLTRYDDALATKVPVIGDKWNNEWKPALIARNYAEKDVDDSVLTDAEMVAKFDDMTNWMRDMWEIHGHINFVLLSGARFCDMYDAEMRPKDPTEAYQLLQGHHTRSVDAAKGLWALGRMVKDSADLTALFDSTPTPQINAQLSGTPDREAFAAALAEFLHEYGWRSDAVYNLADVTWREDPTIPLTSVDAYRHMDDSENPQLKYEAAVRLRDKLMKEYEATLAADPEKLATMRELYTAAQDSYPITEDHAFYIDQLGVALLRKFTKAFGQRLAEKGLIDDAEDVYYLFADEAKATMADGIDRHDLVTERKAYFAATEQLEVPGALGTMPEMTGPPDPWFDAVAVRLLGIKPPATEVDPLVVDGVAGSPGVYTGVARVVRSLFEAGDLEDGEVMVCEMTLPPWVPMFSVAGAVVADVGGIMSHCAIVAREFDLPAVVGSIDGTARIQTGMVVTVDGTNGKVYLDGRSLDG